MFSLPSEHAQALRDLPDTEENAFYWRERRRDARRGEPWRTLLNTVVLLALTFALALLGVWGLLLLTGRIPDWLGGPDGGRVVFALTAGVHALQVGFAARSRVYGVLAREARGGTLFQLLMTRIPAFQIMAQLVAYPFQQGMLAALVGLPFYILLMAWGSIGPQEVLALYVLLAWLATTLPGWRTPALSEQSPEEMGQALRAQERATGCLFWAMAFIYLPGAIITGSILWAIHYANPGIGGRIPPEVWPALPSLPLTFAWVTVRVLTAPCTWFGLPVPPWVGLLLLLAAGRLSSLWLSSMYLRVAHPAQIRLLPDAGAMLAWRADFSRLLLLILGGYLWLPLVESGGPASLFFLSRRGFTPAENLAGTLLLLGGTGLLFAVHRARRFAVTPRCGEEDLRAAARWIAAPFLPLAVSLLAGAVTMPRDGLSLPVGMALAQMAAVTAGAVAFALSLGPGSALAWRWIAGSALVLPLLPLLPVAAFGALNPVLAVCGLSEVFRAGLAQSQPAYLLPPWWAVPLVTLAASAAARLFYHPAPTARVLAHPARPSRRKRAAVVLRRAPAAPPPVAAPALDFILPAEEASPPPAAAPPFPAPALPPLPTPPRPGPPAPAGYRTRALTEWRWRPLSPLAAAALRWLVRRTDNPLALYSARRVLPGTLGTDPMILGGVLLAFGFLVAWFMPDLFLVLALPLPLAALLFPSPLLMLYPEARGMALLIATLILVAMFSALRVCPLTANAYRMERERATLGFLLATPLSSLSIAVGYCVGAVLPALMVWNGMALTALPPMALLALKIGWIPALSGWALGFAGALLYLAVCAACGAWIGITEEKARMVTVGVYLLPLGFCLIGAGAATYAGVNWRWSNAACLAVFAGITLGLLAFLWYSTMHELRRLRRGDLPFEGRSVGS